LKKIKKVKPRQDFPLGEQGWVGSANGLSKLTLRHRPEDISSLK